MEVDDHILLVELKVFEENIRPGEEAVMELYRGQDVLSSNL
jgi:hypothetical protein